ncbi:hypothetical protein LK540_21555 [Massilia sp. IC2-278]|uniref:hypothetical protein n=1 Tax=Massilia sp. IC2-278 TaxID=2887200 RepID=UPI001E2AAD90|nr:hypothetical protein [Massilia sp. IC2-278]MCC2963023.1 hypothetical protein [Massilia sp. IC2-278]
MHTITFDPKNGSVFVNSTPITVDEKGVLVGSIARLCGPPLQTDENQTQYRLLSKISVFGKSADGVIEIGEGRLSAVTFLFDSIEFFESSILESDAIKACEKSLNLNLISDHPSTASSDFYNWGRLIFYYDFKQGDLSLEITFQYSSNEPNLEV